MFGKVKNFQVWVAWRFFEYRAKNHRGGGVQRPPPMDQRVEPRVRRRAKITVLSMFIWWQWRALSLQTRFLQGYSQMSGFKSKTWMIYIGETEKRCEEKERKWERWKKSYFNNLGETKEKKRDRERQTKKEERQRHRDRLYNTSLKEKMRERQTKKSRKER